MVSQIEKKYCEMRGTAGRIRTVGYQSLTNHEEGVFCLDLFEGYYKSVIQENTALEYCAYYFDCNKRMRPVSEREGFQRMITECKNGKIDLIMTDSMYRFAESYEKSGAIARMLASLSHPVGIWFEADNLFSLSDSFYNPDLWERLDAEKDLNRKKWEHDFLEKTIPEFVRKLALQESLSKTRGGTVLINDLNDSGKCVEDTLKQES